MGALTRLKYNDVNILPGDHGPDLTLVESFTHVIGGRPLLQRRYVRSDGRYLILYTYVQQIEDGSKLGDRTDD